MGLFFSKEKQNEITATIAQNVFKDLLLEGEKIEHILKGKCEADKVLTSVGIFAATEKRLLYYSQDFSKIKTEYIEYNKIYSINNINGHAQKVGKYVGIEVELTNNTKKIVRCKVSDENKTLIKELVAYIESKR